jgi:hypothetical protein
MQRERDDEAFCVDVNDSKLKKQRAEEIGPAATGDATGIDGSIF